MLLCLKCSSAVWWGMKRGLNATTEVQRRQEMPHHESTQQVIPPILPGESHLEASPINPPTLEFSSPTICPGLNTLAPSPKKRTPASACWEETWGPVQKNAEEQPIPGPSQVSSWIQCCGLESTPTERHCQAGRRSVPCRPFYQTGLQVLPAWLHNKDTKGPDPAISTGQMEREAPHPLQNCRRSHPSHSSRILSDTCVEQEAD